MLHVATLFCVHLDVEPEFVRLIRGDWQRLARRVAPDLVGTDLLRQQQDAPLTVYLCLDFWTNAEAYRRAFYSATVRELLAARCSLAGSYFHLGEFAFPSLSNSIPTARILLD
jgi:hypothetical protein